MSAIPRPRPDRGGPDPVRPSHAAGHRPAPPPARTVASPPKPPDMPLVERRRHRRGWFSKWLYAPLPLAAVELGAERVSKQVWPWLRWVLVTLAVGALVAGAWWWAWVQAPVLTPRHRAEALCFVLAERPVFAPSMHVESGAAMVRGRFSTNTPPDLAIRAAMRVTDDMVLTERRRQVGDYDVSVMWLRLPTPGGGGHHWLVVGWMEDSDLAMCSFRFAGDPTDLASTQILWGSRLTDRILQPEYFQAGRTPDVRWRASGGETLPSFGPRERD